MNRASSKRITFARIIHIVGDVLNGIGILGLIYVVSQDVSLWQ